MCIGIPRWHSGKESTCQCKRCKRRGLNPWVGTISLEEGMATHSNILAWEIPWTEGPSGLQSTELQRVGHDWARAHANMCIIPRVSVLWKIVDPSGFSTQEFDPLDTLKIYYYSNYYFYKTYLQFQNDLRFRYRNKSTVPVVGPGDCLGLTNPDSYSQSHSLPVLSTA